MQPFLKKDLIFASGLQENVPAEFSQVIIDNLFVINIKLWFYLYIGLLLTYQFCFCQFHENMSKNYFGNLSSTLTARIHLTVFCVNLSDFPDGVSAGITGFFRCVSICSSMLRGIS